MVTRRTADRPVEVGERVQFRSLDWEVAGVSDRTITLFGRQLSNRGRTVQALIDLEAVERVAPPPLRYDVAAKDWDPADWQSMHDAFRLTLSQSRGSLGTAAWGRLILEPYQLVPLKRIEGLPEPRILIADDMGLGKTSEAGLILSRLLQRRRADRVLVVTRARPEPERWRDELLEKFGLDFEVINDGSDYARLRRAVPTHLNLYAAIPRLIVSMHFAAQADRLPDLDRPGLRWDAAVIDEAHHVADRGGDTRLSALGRVVALKSNALLLLTATPHDGKVGSFASLVELIDEYAVADKEHLQPRLVRPLMVRRLKSQVVKSGGERFVQPEIEVVDVEPSRLPAEHHLEKGIRSYAKQLRDQQRLLENQGERGAAAGFGFLESLLRKRLASSVLACERTLQRRLDGTTTPGEGETDDMPSQEGLPGLAVLPNGKTEHEVLADLLQRCRRIPSGEEGKLRGLGDVVGAIAGRSEKVVVFTEFRDTLEAMLGVLAQRGLKEGLQVLTYHGDTPNRDEVRRRFLEDPQVLVLAATDAASEGINLQLTCNHLVHVEVPWNPNRYEQRNGRIDRYGQQLTPHVIMLVARGYVEQRAAEIVMTKLAQIARDVGSVSNVAPFARAVPIEKYLADHAGDGEQDEDVEAVAAGLGARLDAELKDTTDAVPEELLSGEGFERGDLARVEGELAEVAAFAPSFDDVRLFLSRYLAQDGGSITELAGEPGVYRCKLGEHLRVATGVDELLRATFDRTIANAEANLPRAQRVHFLSPGHPVVMAALRRARSWVMLPGFASRVNYRRVGEGVDAAVLFTYGTRFLDGRGETVEERFDVVAVNVAGAASMDAEADRTLFLAPEQRGMLSPPEEYSLRVVLPGVFERLKAAADESAAERAQQRLEAIDTEQRRIADEALIRVGVWRERAEARIAERAGAQMALALDATARRRQTLSERQLAQVAERAEHRRLDIERMRECRVESIDPIGALVLLPPGGWPSGS